MSNINFRIVAEPSLRYVSVGANITYKIEATGSKIPDDLKCQWICRNDPETVPDHPIVKGPKDQTKWQVGESSGTWTKTGNHVIICSIWTESGRVDCEYHQQVMEVPEAAAQVLLPISKFDPEASLSALKRYIQTIESAAEGKTPTEKFEQRLENIKYYYEKFSMRFESINGLKRFAVKAEHFHQESQKRTPLKVFLAKKSDGEWLLADFTNPSLRSATGTYEGKGNNDEKAIIDAFDSWRAHNRYSIGVIRFEVDRGVCGAKIDGRFDTDGDSFWDSVSNVAGYIAFGTAVVALCLTPIPGTRVAAGAMITTALLSSTTSATINITRRFQEGFASWGANAFDALAIVSNFFGAGALVVWAKQGTVLTTQAGKMFLIGEVTAEGAQGILVGKDIMDQWEAIMNDEEIDPDDKVNRLLLLVGQGVATGALLALSVKGTKADLDAMKKQSLRAGSTDEPANQLKKLGEGGEIDACEAPKLEGKADKDKEHKSTATTEVETPEPRLRADSVISKPQTQYPGRRDIQSVEEFTKEGVDFYDWLSLKNQSNWVAQRSNAHNQLIDKAVADMRAFAEFMKDHEPTIFALRGNTAAGKTRTIKTGKIPELEEAVKALENKRHMAINPDNFKTDLREIDTEKFGLTPTHSQVHMESAVLGSELMEKANTLRRGSNSASVLIDKRLASTRDMEELTLMAKESGRKLNIYDIDAELEQSLTGVLGRSTNGEDPIPPFDAIGSGGFMAIRVNREKFIAKFQEDPTLGKYNLFSTLPDGSKKLVAKVESGELKILDQEKYQQLTNFVKKSEIDAIKNTTIDDGLIARITEHMPEGGWKSETIEALKKYKGKTWEEAVNIHGGNTKK